MSIFTKLLMSKNSCGRHDKRCSSSNNTTGSSTTDNRCRFGSLGVVGHRRRSGRSSLVATLHDALTTATTTTTTITRSSYNSTINADNVGGHPIPRRPAFSSPVKTTPKTTTSLRRNITRGGRHQTYHSSTPLIFNERGEMDDCFYNIATKTTNNNHKMKYWKPRTVVFDDDDDDEFDYDDYDDDYFPTSENGVTMKCSIRQQQQQQQQRRTMSTRSGTTTTTSHPPPPPPTQQQKISIRRSRRSQINCNSSKSRNGSGSTRTDVRMVPEILNHSVPSFRRPSGIVGTTKRDRSCNTVHSLPPSSATHQQHKNAVATDNTSTEESSSSSGTETRSSIAVDDANYYNNCNPFNDIVRSTGSKRIRRPTQFYSNEYDTTTIMPVAKSFRTTVSQQQDITICINDSDGDGDTNDISKTATTAITERPKRKCEPTEFFSPSELSILYIATRSVTCHQSLSNCIPYKSDTTTTPTSALQHEPKIESTNDTPISVCSSGTSLESSDTNNSERDISSCISYEMLLAKYNHRVARGECYPVSFGTNITTVVSAVNRKLQHLQTKTNKNHIDVYDAEVIADIREYKRSLRAFSVYEDREKLASMYEEQEDLELRGRRRYATVNKNKKKFAKNTKYENSDKKDVDSGCSKNNNNSNQWTEIMLFEERPIVISTSGAATTRMMSRRYLPCTNDEGIDCIFGCHFQKSQRLLENTTRNTKYDLLVPIPSIQPFHIDDDDADANNINKTENKEGEVEHQLSRGVKRPRLAYAKRNDTTFSKQLCLQQSNGNKRTNATIVRSTIDALHELKYALQFMASYQNGSSNFTSASSSIATDATSL